MSMLHLTFIAIIKEVKVCGPTMMGASNSMFLAIGSARQLSHVVSKVQITKPSVHNRNSVAIVTGGQSEDPFYSICDYIHPPNHSRIIPAKSNLFKYMSFLISCPKLQPCNRPLN